MKEPKSRFRYLNGVIVLYVIAGVHRKSTRLETVDIEVN